MSAALLISTRLQDGRYNGAGDWPPSPARLFQALVAGVGLSGPLSEADLEALEWLEKRIAKPEMMPLVGAPVMHAGQRAMFYMPNNDLDAVGGDPRRLAEIRTATKFVRPSLFDASVPFLYIWPLDATEEHEPYSRGICALAERLYQLGRGVDMAWAWADVLDASSLAAILSSYPGRIYRPSRGSSGTILPCPHPGSLQSIKARYEAHGRRFQVEGEGSAARPVFSKPPRPSFRRVAYDNPPSWFLYELREPSSQASFAPWPLARASRLVVCMRNGAVERLRMALPTQGVEVERVLVGRKPDDTNEGSAVARVRIVPLSSIGHQHADRRIRRVLVEVPAGCPLRGEDVHWAFSGLELTDTEMGEALNVLLIPAADESMVTRHYGVGEHTGSRIWRSVTPVAVPDVASRRRIKPVQGKGSRERLSEQARTAAAVIQALRHVNVHQQPDAIRVQREPFEGNGERVEAFAPGTRFPKERLWHVEITFGAPLVGPLVIGDGRFLGLGVMAPLPRTQGVHAFVIEAGLAANPKSAEITRALRRAVMARVQEVLGAAAALPSFFTGHERDGARVRSEHTKHLAFVFDPRLARVLVVAPHVLDRRDPAPQERNHLMALEQALEDFRELRAGASGLLTLRASSVDVFQDSLFAPSQVWESLTPYQVTRHAKGVSAADAFSTDLRAECHRRGLPDPDISPREPHGVQGVGLVGGARLMFRVAVGGPIILGRSRHFGGGLFGGTAQ